jgi:hypothetical protein
MVQFGNYIRTSPKERDQKEMRRLSLALAHAMRKSVGPSFDLKPTELAGARFK